VAEGGLDGLWEGIADGVREGGMLGLAEGLLVGVLLGVSDGSALGVLDGLVEGVSEGAILVLVVTVGDSLCLTMGEPVTTGVKFGLPVSVCSVVMIAVGILLDVEDGGLLAALVGLLVAPVVGKLLGAPIVGDAVCGDVGVEDGNSNSLSTKLGVSDAMFVGDADGTSLSITMMLSTHVG
jgi:hypothetical protein